MKNGINLSYANLSRFRGMLEHCPSIGRELVSLNHLEQFDTLVGLAQEAGNYLIERDYEIQLHAENVQRRMVAITAAVGLGEMSDITPKIGYRPLSIEERRDERLALARLLVSGPNADIDKLRTDIKAAIIASRFILDEHRMTSFEAMLEGLRHAEPGKHASVNACVNAISIAAELKAEAEVVLASIPAVSPTPPEELAARFARDVVTVCDNTIASDVTALRNMAPEMVAEPA